MKAEALSNRYTVRSLVESDIPAVYELCSKNVLYYEYCPPFITPEAIKKDMEALPPGKTYEDKYFVGFFEGKTLIAVLDLIAGYPNDSTAYIGFFMTDVQVQGKGIGTIIITELSESCKSQGFQRMELAWVKGNPQAEHFWEKNGFDPIGERSSTAADHVIVAEKLL